MEQTDHYTKWTQMLNERKASGQTVRAFCSDRNITEHCYYYWRKKIADLESDQSGFTELVDLPNQNVLMDIEVGHIRVSLYRPVNVAYVSRLLKELRKD